MFTDTQKLNMLLENLTGWAGYSCKDLDDETFLKLIKKAKSQREQLQSVNEIAHKSLKPPCYKADCNQCPCYVQPKGQKLSDLLNTYFTEDADFNDGDGTFVQDLESLIERERKACKRTLPMAWEIIRLLDLERNNNNE